MRASYSIEIQYANYVEYFCSVSENIILCIIVHLVRAKYNVDST